MLKSKENFGLQTGREWHCGELISETGGRKGLAFSILETLKLLALLNASGLQMIFGSA